MNDFDRFMNGDDSVLNTTVNSYVASAKSEKHKTIDMFSNLTGQMSSIELAQYSAMMKRQNDYSDVLLAQISDFCDRI